MNEIVGAIKRCVEVLSADPSLEGDPARAATAWEIALPESVLQALAGGTATPETEAWQAHLRTRARQRQALYEELVPDCPHLAAWRQRQARRCLSELGGSRAEVVLHYPAAFELTRGCSVGCWFCGFAAPRLDGVSAGELDLWRGLLGALQNRVGAAARRAFCYWATDPLDHPQYEDYCREFFRVLGGWPRTTTALAPRQLERTRTLLREAHTHGSRWDRLSILNLADLRRVYQAFTPAELLDVELVVHTRPDLLRATAGRARPAVAEGRRTARAFPAASELAGTIACVSGFLVNLVERRVRLITPCNADARRPLGYRVLGEAHFETAADFATALSELTTPDRLEVLPAPDRRLRWRQDLQVVGERLRSPHLEHRVECGRSPSAGLPGQVEAGPPPAALADESPSAWQALRDRLADSGTTLGEAMAALEVTCDQAPAVTRYRLLELWGAGLLDDSPGGAIDPCRNGQAHMQC